MPRYSLTAPDQSAIRPKGLEGADIVSESRPLVAFRGAEQRVALSAEQPKKLIPADLEGTRTFAEQTAHSKCTDDVDTGVLKA